MTELLQTRRLFIVILAIGLFVLAARNVTDPDVWWHLRTGELMVASHHVFHADPYSFTKAGQPWVDHEWLSQLLIFSLYEVGSWAGLIVGFAVLIALTFFVVFLRCTGRPYVAGAMTAWAAVASVPSWGVRPQMCTLLLASLFLLVLERSTRRPNLLWWTPLLMLWWVNLHAGYAVGIALLAIFLFGEVLDRVFGISPPKPTRFRNLAVALLACIAIVPLNPYGFTMYRYPLETLHSRAMLAYIGEWASPDFHQGRYAAFLLMLLATMAFASISPRRLRPSQLFLLAILTYAALRSVRHIPLFVLVAAPILSELLTAALERWKKMDLLGRSQPLTLFKLVFNVIILAAFLTFSVARIRVILHNQAEVEVKEFPAAAVAFLQAHQLPRPVMNHYNWGGYFIWKLYPEYKVYIDGRADLYGDRFMDQFAAAYFVKGQAWEAALNQWHPQTVVLPPDAPLITALRLQPGWNEMFVDAQAVVLSRSR